MRIAYFIANMFLLLSSFLNAQDDSFVATVDRNILEEGARFQVQFTLNNQDGRDFKAPSFKGFTVLMGPSTSQQYSMVNGRTTRSVSYTYVLKADQKGTYTIEPAYINVGGSQLRTKPISITVTDAGAAQKQANDAEKSLSSQAQELLEKYLYLRVNVSKKDVFIGEPVVVTYKLYRQAELSIVSYDISEEPVFNGFWTNNIDIDRSESQEIINGERFIVYDIKKVVLFPQQSGNLKVGSYKFNFVSRLKVQGQRKRSRSLFDDFFDDPFFGGSYKDFSYSTKTPEVNIRVKPTPSPTPTSFRGGVGNLSMKAWLDKPKTKANEPVNLKIEISGNGNLKLIEPFDLNLPSEIEAYDPKINDEISISTSGMAGKRVFEYLIIPRNKGKFKIDPIQFTYFDPINQKYIDLESDQFNLEVSEGSGDATTIVSGSNQEDFKLLGKDIRYIHTKFSSLGKDKHQLLGSALFWSLIIIPNMLFILFLFIRKKDKQLNENIALAKNRKASKMAKKKLSLAKKFLDNNDRNKFYEEVSKAIWGYISDKLNINYSELTKDRAIDTLSKFNLDDDSTAQLLLLLDQCEFERFAPSSGESQMKNVYDSAALLITNLEAKIK